MTLVRKYSWPGPILHIGYASIGATVIGIDTRIKRGSGELAILALLDREPLHGYEISKRIAHVTGGVLQFNLASLYPLL